MNQEQKDKAVAKLQKHIADLEAKVVELKEELAEAEAVVVV